jgi:hypothetical protein
MPSVQRPYVIYKGGSIEAFSTTSNMLTAESLHLDDHEAADNAPAND